MNFSLFVGDNSAAKRVTGWGASIGRMVLPAGLFVIAALGGLAARDGNVAIERVVLGAAGNPSTVHLENATVMGER